MGHQRRPRADTEQKHWPVLSARGQDRNWNADRSDDSESALACCCCTNAFLQASEIMSYPENYKYTKEHEWVLLDGGNGTVGITDHAQNELGDIVYVDLPKV